MEQQQGDALHGREVDARQVAVGREGSRLVHRQAHLWIIGG